MNTGSESEQSRAEEEKSLTNPRCPECGGEEFVYRRVPEEKKRRIDNKRRKGLKRKIRRGYYHVSVVYCINCGEIIGTAGGFHS